MHAFSLYQLHQSVHTIFEIQRCRTHSDGPWTSPIHASCGRVAIGPREISRGYMGLPVVWFLASAGAAADGSNRAAAASEADLRALFNSIDVDGSGVWARRGCASSVSVIVNAAAHPQRGVPQGQGPTSAQAWRGQSVFN